MVTVKAMVEADPKAFNTEGGGEFVIREATNRVRSICLKTQIIHVSRFNLQQSGYCIPLGYRGRFIMT